MRDKLCAHSAGAAQSVGLLEIKLVHPEVGRVLDASDHRPRLVEGAVVLHQRAVVEGGRPQERAPLLGRGAEAEPLKGGLAPLLHLGQVHEESEHAGPARQLRVGGDVVVVPAVVLPHLCADMGPERGE